MELYGQLIDENNIDDVFQVVSNHKACVKENVFKKYFNNLYNQLMKIDYPSDFSFAQKIYHFLRNDILLKCGLCQTCGNRTKFLGFTKGYRTYCSSVCMGNDKEFWDKHKQTSLNRYGCEFPSQSDKIKNKIKKTNLKKYGTEYSFQSNDVKNKIKETNLKKYGTEHYNNSVQIKKTLNNKSEKEWRDIINKREQTYKKKTGYSNPFENPDVKQKIRQTNLKKYGTEIASQSDSVKQKISATKLNYTDEENTLINLKRSDTCLKLYGKSTISQLDFIKEKISQSKKEHNLQKYDNVKSIIDSRIFCCYCNDEQCNLCKDKEFLITRSMYLKRQKHNEELCTIKNPINHSSSYEEKDFRNFISEIYKKNIIYNDRQILKGKEIDVYIPELKLGFEFNGIYFHSELYKSKSYHQEKTILAQKSDISLIQIWEDDWSYKRTVVESIIKRRLGLCDLYDVNKCQIKDINIYEAKDFIKHNDLCEYIESDINLGLYHNNMLISILTLKKYNTSDYEICNFSIKNNMNVNGGFQKLLNYFIDIYYPSKITAKISLDLNSEHIYIENGFKNVKILDVDYIWSNSSTENKYLFNNKRHRFNKREMKQFGYDKFTDNELYERDFLKCYNSGYVLLEKIIKNGNDILVDYK